MVQSTSGSLNDWGTGSLKMILVTVNRWYKLKAICRIKWSMMIDGEGYQGHCQLLGPNFNAHLVGGIPTPLKNIHQLGWWHSQYMENNTCSKPPIRSYIYLPVIQKAMETHHDFTVFPFGNDVLWGRCHLDFCTMITISVGPGRWFGCNQENPLELCYIHIHTANIFTVIIIIYIYPCDYWTLYTYTLHSIFIYREINHDQSSSMGNKNNKLK
jgi:hypothetical protein